MSIERYVHCRSWPSPGVSRGAAALDLTASADAAPVSRRALRRLTCKGLLTALPVGLAALLLPLRPVCADTTTPGRV